MSALNQQFITSTGRIGPGAGPMKNNGPILNIRGPEPKRNCEGLLAAKVSQTQIDGIVARELNGVARLTRHKFVVTSQRCRTSADNRIGQLVSCERLKFEASKLWQCDCLGRTISSHQPCFKRGPSGLAKLGGLMLDLLNSLL